MHWDYLSQGGHEHWGDLSRGGVVQGRIKVISRGMVRTALGIAREEVSNTGVEY